jgi:hypothetical protein
MSIQTKIKPPYHKFISRINLLKSSNNLLKSRINFASCHLAHYILPPCNLHPATLHTTSWQDAKLNPYLIQL